MPPHIAIYTATTNDLADPIAITISGGEESGVTALDFWNDKNDDFLDTETAQDMVLKILASVSGGPYLDAGTPILDERWSRVRILGKLTAAGFTTDGATGTLPVGVNSEFPLPDLDPQTGVRIEFYVAAPFGQTADAVKIKLQPVGNLGSSPLAKFVGLASGSGIVPGDRIAGLRAILRGSVVVADDTDTITIGRGMQVYEGVSSAFLETTYTFNLEDGDAVELDAAEAYNVTLSRTSAAALVVTKGPKAEAVEFPAVPDGNILVARLTVESADGIAVTVSPSSVDQGFSYHEFSVHEWTSLAVIVGPGDGLTDAGFRQPSSHFTVVSVAASNTSRIWRLSNGSKTATLTDVPPEAGADLLAYVTTDASNVTAIVDARVFVHRALVTERIVLTYSGVLSVAPIDTLLAWTILPECELERVTMDLSDSEGAWTGGDLRADLLTVAPGQPLTGGTTIYTNSATDDARPSLPFDATNLRTVSVDHEVRRFVDGTRIYLVLDETFTVGAPEPAQEVRVTLYVRRYR